MLSDKAELILYLVRQGRAVDVLALMEGESPYTSEASEGAPMDNALGQLWVGALYHLRFVEKFGETTVSQVKDGKVESSFPDVFMQWLEAGAPGVGLLDLKAYLEDNPL
ncbi:hypothetical protein [Chromobacterium sp. Beijing]|uniref:hypothetical protein n=1 Tax=Chromobacterium sp. Beijing TaxID=2735795 RepID=UPI001F172BC5|nr:hypothetical protein [Chromobacterium sp. Beijing]UJB31880.1 hypothetical protein HQN78_12890 [Chromobacterium sp. Beijing]